MHIAQLLFVPNWSVKM